MPGLQVALNYRPEQRQPVMILPNDTPQSSRMEKTSLNARKAYENRLEAHMNTSSMFWFFPPYYFLSVELHE